MARALNIRQQRFAEFVVSGESATQAYIRAGYKVSEKVAGTNGPRLLEHAGVAQLISALRAKDTSKALLTKDEKRQMLADRVRMEPNVSDLVKLLAEDSKLAGHYEAEKLQVDMGEKTLEAVKERADRVVSTLIRRPKPKD